MCKRVTLTCLSQLGFLWSIGRCFARAGDWATPSSLPVDTSTRVFRRACSEPRFPFERVERESVILKKASIQLRWLSGRAPDSAEPGHRGAPPTAKSPTRGEPEAGPHQWGFGPVPLVQHPSRSPPLCLVRDGVLGPQPPAHASGIRRRKTIHRRMREAAWRPVSPL